MANKILTTPKGVAQWPKLQVPDKKYGCYAINLRFDAESDEAKELMATIDALHNEAVADACTKQKKKKVKAQNKPYVLVTDQEGVETGEVDFKFKQRATSTNQTTGQVTNFRVLVTDAKRHPMKEEIGNGSICRVAYEPNLYWSDAHGAGVQLRLKAVQVIEKKEWSGFSVESVFDEEEGYEVEEGDAVAATKGADSDDDDSGDL